MLAHFFVNRPIFAWVISLVIMIAGTVSLGDTDGAAAALDRAAAECRAKGYVVAERRAAAASSR